MDEESTIRTIFSITEAFLIFMRLLFASGNIEQLHFETWKLKLTSFLIVLEFGINESDRAKVRG